MSFKFTDLKLSQSLIDAASKVVGESNKKVADQAAAEAPMYSKMHASLRPLAAENIDYTASPAVAAKKRLTDTITQVHNSTIKEQEAAQQERAALIQKSYGKKGGVAPIVEAELSPKQKKIASVAGDPKKIDAYDFKVLRDRKSKISQDVADSVQLDGEVISEKDDEKKSDNTPFNWKSYKSNIPSKPGEKAGFDSKKISTGTVYSRKWTKEKNPNEDVKSESVEENTDTPGNSYEHQCAIHVKNESFGIGRTIPTQHAEPDENGLVEWYDVMFEHGIEKRVPITELEVLESMSHGNHPLKKKKKA
jgi:hypothetical protein